MCNLPYLTTRSFKKSFLIFSLLTYPTALLLGDVEVIEHDEGSQFMFRFEETGVDVVSAVTRGKRWI